MRSLKTSYNPEVSKVIEEAIEKTNESAVGRDMEGFSLQSLSKLNVEVD